MGRRGKLPGPSHLARVLTSLNAAPRLSLQNIKSLRLSLAFQNDHFGARHFVKEQLPRIRWANPDLDIRVEKVRKTAEEAWRPEIEVEFADGNQHTVDMHEKWSTAILKELMEVAGGDPWRQWKLEATAAGLPLVAGEGNEDRVVKRPARIPLPSLTAFRKIQMGEQPRTLDSVSSHPAEQEIPIPPPPKSKAGARVLSF